MSDSNWLRLKPVQALLHSKQHEIPSRWAIRSFYVNKSRINDILDLGSGKLPCKQICELQILSAFRCTKVPPMKFDINPPIMNSWSLSCLVTVRECFTMPQSFHCCGTDRHYYGKEFWPILVRKLQFETVFDSKVMPPFKYEPLCFLCIDEPLLFKIWTMRITSDRNTVSNYHLLMKVGQNSLPLYIVPGNFPFQMTTLEFGQLFHICPIRHLMIKFLNQSRAYFWNSMLNEW